jgi:hypothetical protein
MTQYENRPPQPDLIENDDEVDAQDDVEDDGEAGELRAGEDGAGE